MKRWRVMCNMFYKTYDGYDYMTVEADEEIYTNRDEAVKARKEYQTTCTRPDVEFFVKEVEAA